MDGHTKAGHVASYILVPDHRQLFRWSGGHRTWDHVRLRVSHLVTKLRTQIKVGDRVCTLALTSADHLEVLLAITAAGGIAAPLNWRWSRQEVDYAVKLLGAKLLIADDHCWSLASSVGGQSSMLPLTKLSSMLPARLPLTTLPFFSFHQQPPDASAFIIFTSGTTGPARAAVLTHDALDFQCRQKQLVCGYHRDDVYLHTSPLFHVGGLCSALAMLRAGATHVFFPPPSAPTFSASVTLQTIQTHNVTSFIAVPTMIVDMIDCAIDKTKGQSQKQRLSFSSVTTILVGAGGLSDPHVASLSHLFPNAALWSAYGMTECCSSITFARLPIHASIARNAVDASMVYVGTPPAGIQIKISGQPVQQRGLGVDGIGEILTRGPHVMLRYWNDADHDDVDAVFDTTSGDGSSSWLRTGDMGWLDPEGHVWLVGRIKDVIKSGGENVPAARVERTLTSHPSVAAAAVVGLPDPRLGERVAAAIVLTQNGLTWCGESIQIVSKHRDLSCTQSSVDGKLLQDHCRSVGLPGFMVPRVFLCVEELPMNSTGKVIKSRVRDVMMSALAQRHAAVSKL